MSFAIETRFTSESTTLIRPSGSDPGRTLTVCNKCDDNNGSMLKIRRSCPEDTERVVEIWRNAVDATHDFLSTVDRTAIDEQVQELLPKALLWLAVDDGNRPVAFMGLSDSHMDSLFVDPSYHGRGIGRCLVEHASMLHPILTTEVNEENVKAVGFYRRLGFVETGWSPTDKQGRAYPLVHLRLDSKG